MWRSQGNQINKPKGTHPPFFGWTALPRNHYPVTTQVVSPPPSRQTLPAPLGTAAALATSSLASACRNTKIKTPACVSTFGRPLAAAAALATSSLAMAVNGMYRMRGHGRQWHVPYVWPWLSMACTVCVAMAVNGMASALANNKPLVPGGWRPCRVRLPRRRHALVRSCGPLTFKVVWSCGRAVVWSLGTCGECG